MNNEGIKNNQNNEAETANKWEKLTDYQLEQEDLSMDRIKKAYPQQEGEAEPDYEKRVQGLQQLFQKLDDDERAKKQIKDSEGARTEHYEASEQGKSELGIEKKLDEIVRKIDEKVQDGIFTKERAEKLKEQALEKATAEIEKIRNDYLGKLEDEQFAHQAVASEEDEKKYAEWLARGDAEEQKEDVSVFKIVDNTKEPENRQTNDYDFGTADLYNIHANGALGGIPRQDKEPKTPPIVVGESKNKDEDYLTGLHDIVGATPKKDDEVKQAATKDESNPSSPEKAPDNKLTDEEKEVLKNNGYEYDEKNKIIRYREKANTAEKQGWFNRISDWFKNHNFSFFGKGKREKELEEASKANQPAPASDNRNTGKNETTDEGNMQEAGKDVADNTDEQAKNKQSEKSYEKFEKRADILAKNIYAALAAGDDNLDQLIEATLQANSRLYWPDRVTQDLLTFSSKENEEMEIKSLMNAYNAAEYIISKSPRWEEYQNRRNAIRGEIRSDYH